MSLYLIAYDLDHEEPSKYDEIDRKLKVTFQDCVFTLNTTWLVNTSLDIDSIVGLISAHFKATDELLIITINKPYRASSLNPAASEWLRKYLS